MNKIALTVIMLASCLLGSAHAQSGIGEPCQNTTDCRTTIGLECRENICQCQIDSIYNGEVARCQVLAGGSCADWRECGKDAYCQDTNKTCLCHANYFTGPDRLCHLSNNHPCLLSSDCHPNDHLICAAGKCKCQRPISQYWNWSNYTCNIKVGFACDPSSSITCGDDKICVAHNESITGYRCQCANSNHIVTVDRTRCSPRNMQPCSDDLFCDSLRGLSCFQGVCQCINAPDQIWDEENLACTGIEGTMCSYYNTDKREPIQRCGPNLGCGWIDGPDDKDVFYGICVKSNPSVVE